MGHKLSYLFLRSISDSNRWKYLIVYMLHVLSWRSFNLILIYWLNWCIIWLISNTNNLIHTLFFPIAQICSKKYRSPKLCSEFALFEWNRQWVCVWCIPEPPHQIYSSKTVHTSEQITSSYWSLLAWLEHHTFFRQELNLLIERYFSFVAAKTYSFRWAYPDTSYWCYFLPK